MGRRPGRCAAARDLPPAARRHRPRRCTHPHTAGGDGRGGGSRDSLGPWPGFVFAKTAGCVHTVVWPNLRPIWAFWPKRRQRDALLRPSSRPPDGLWPCISSRVKSTRTYYTYQGPHHQPVTRAARHAPRCARACEVDFTLCCAQVLGHLTLLVACLACTRCCSLSGIPAPHCRAPLTAPAHTAACVVHSVRGPTLLTAPHVGRTRAGAHNDTFEVILTGSAQERPPPAAIGDQRDGPEVLAAPGGLALATPILKAPCP